MGACCTTEQKINIKTLIFIQAGVRRWIARRRREEARLEYINQITGKTSLDNMSQGEGMISERIFRDQQVADWFLIDADCVQCLGVNKRQHDALTSVPLFSPEEI